MFMSVHKGEGGGGKNCPKSCSHSLWTPPNPNFLIKPKMLNSHFYPVNRQNIRNISYQPSLFWATHSLRYSNTNILSFSLFCLVPHKLSPMALKFFGWDNWACFRCWFSNRTMPWNLQISRQFRLAWAGHQTKLK